MSKLKHRFALVTAAALLGLAGCASTGGNTFFDDAATTMRVKKAIFNDPSLQVMNISVTTRVRLAACGCGMMRAG